MSVRSSHGPKQTRRSRVAALSLVVCLVLAGCLTGGVGDEHAFGTTERTTTASEPVANGTLEVHFIDVGQSTSVLVVGPDGRTMLIDSGDFRDRGEHVLRYLRHENVSRIDVLVTSHADADHIGGHAAVIEYYETQADGVGAIYDPGIAASTLTYERYLDAVERHEVPLYRTVAGDSIPFGNASVKVFAPPDPPLADRERNENSVVLRVAYGGTSFLLTGDGEAAAERYLVTTYGDRLDATVLAAGHHGSRTSTSAAFLDAVSPEFVVISSAYDSQYGHPHDEVLERLAEWSIPTYWTATHGTTVFTSNGTSVAVEAQANATTQAEALRSAPPAGSDSSPVAGGETGATTPNAVADGGTTGPLVVDEVHADAAGDDGENLGDEYVVFRNAGAEPLDLGGWTVRDEAGHEYTFPAGTAVKPDATVTLRTGRGEDGGGELYWRSERPIWNNGGDTVYVRTPDGMLVVEEEYA